MGGKQSSVKDIAETITNIVQSTTINTLQISSQNVLSTQSLQLSCQKASSTYLGFIEKTLPSFTKKIMESFTPEQVQTILANQIDCSARDVTLTGTIVFAGDVNQQMATIQIVKNNVSSAVNQAVSSAGGSGSTVDNFTKTVTNILTNTLIEKSMKALQDEASSQQINISGGNVSQVSLTAASKVIEDTLASDNSYNSAVNDLAQSISQGAKDDSSTSLIEAIYNIIKKIVYIVIGALALLGVIIFIIKVYF